VILEALTNIEHKKDIKRQADKINLQTRNLKLILNYLKVFNDFFLSGFRRFLV